MQKHLFLLGIVLLLLASCSPVDVAETSLVSTPELTETATPFQSEPMTALPEPVATTTPTMVMVYPEEGYGPANFPAQINPLTGLQVADPEILDRRPVLVKVTNLPRSSRPQWGLSKADIVYEYYTEGGTTRFAALYYGQDAEQIGPIRSGRLVDVHLIRMYQAIIAYGSADERVHEKLYNTEFADRLMLEWEAKCPAMCRFEPAGANYLLGNSQALTVFANGRNLSGGNGKQNLDGMFFQMQAPGGGLPAVQVFARFSSGIYNRWDYDPTLGRYLRFSDTENDMQGGKNEVYAPLLDRATGEQIAADNVVVLFVPHQYFSRTPEIVDIVMAGTGMAYAFRDGQMYELRWQRLSQDSGLRLVFPDGSPYALKPGTTWFEVMGSSSNFTSVENGYRFRFSIP